jgi:uncharacterized protein (TIGR02594 family)
MQTLQIQKALKQKGFDPGPLDGVRGASTIAAIMAYQRANGLVVDGVVGPATAARLFDSKPPADVSSLPGQALPWMIGAEDLLGVKEDTSDADNPLIMGWAKGLKISYANDETAWCGLFVAHCIGTNLPNEPRPNSPLSARAWLKFGKATSAQFGAVIVFWRGSPGGWQGHVGFYVGEDDKAYHVLGGNQSNRVSVARMPKGRFLGARWPSQVADPKAGPRWLDAQGALSHNEA